MRDTINICTQIGADAWWASLIWNKGNKKRVVSSDYREMALSFWCGSLWIFLSNDIDRRKLRYRYGRDFDPSKFNTILGDIMRIYSSLLFCDLSKVIKLIVYLFVALPVSQSVMWILTTISFHCDFFNIFPYYIFYIVCRKYLGSRQTADSCRPCMGKLWICLSLSRGNF